MMNFDFQGIQGFDISTYQDAPTIPGHINFQKMRDWGASFVIIKAGQGSRMDQDFPINWGGAKGILPRAPYFYYDNLYPPKQQALKYYDILRADPEGICWLDLEDRLAGNYSGWRNWYDFIAQFESLFGSGVQVGIYTGLSYFKEYTLDATPAQREYFKRFPLWLASYPLDPFHPPYADLLVPPPWTECLILQSGTPSIGPLAGVESLEIDYDQFNGDAQKFKKYFGGVPISPPSTGDSMELEVRSKVPTEVRSIRNGPAITKSKIGELPFNGAARSHGADEDIYEYSSDVPNSTIVGGYSARAGDKWVRVYSVNGNPAALESWLAVVHLGVVYTTLKELGEPGSRPPLSVQVTLSGKGYVTKSITETLEPEP